MERESKEAVTLRAATREDLRAVTELLQANALPTVGVAEAMSDFVVAESGGRVIGVTGLEMCGPRYALLRSAAVVAEWQGRGVGRLLVERVIASAESRGLDGLYLLTTTAERYFPAFGFSTIAREAVPSDVKRSEEFTSACPASAIVMMRPIDSAGGGSAPPASTPRARSK